MKLLTVSVGLPRDLTWNEQDIRTAIIKSPVRGRVALHTLNLDGDRQADLSVHGGRNKAVYCYPIEHYDAWMAELPWRREWPHGTFGENFTTEGLLEDAVHVGDRFAIGSAEIVVTQPRMPCYKLGAHFRSDDIIRRFLAAGRPGFYVAVTREGEVGAGDAIAVVSRDPHAVSVSDLWRLRHAKTFAARDVDIARRAVQVEWLPNGWKDAFRAVLASDHRAD